MSNFIREKNQSSKKIRISESCSIDSSGSTLITAGENLVPGEQWSHEQESCACLSCMARKTQEFLDPASSLGFVNKHPSGRCLKLCF